MKKIALILAILTVMSLTTMAQAEAKIIGHSESVLTAPLDNDRVISVSYSIKVELSDGSYESIEVNEDVYNRIVADMDEEYERRSNTWYAKTTRWCLEKMEALEETITFWD